MLSIKKRAQVFNTLEDAVTTFAEERYSEEDEQIPEETESPDFLNFEINHKGLLKKLKYDLGLEGRWQRIKSVYFGGGLFSPSTGYYNEDEDIGIIFSGDAKGWPIRDTDISIITVFIDRRGGQMPFSSFSEILECLIPELSPDSPEDNNLFLLAANGGTKYRVDKQLEGFQIVPQLDIDICSARIQKAKGFKGRRLSASFTKPLPQRVTQIT